MIKTKKLFAKFSGTQYCNDKNAFVYQVFCFYYAFTLQTKDMFTFLIKLQRLGVFLFKIGSVIMFIWLFEISNWSNIYFT